MQSLLEEDSTPDRSYRRRLLWFVLLSLLVHMWLVGDFGRWLARRSQQVAAATPPPLTVHVQMPQTAESRQIVDAPRVASSTPPKNGFLGRRDQTVPHETIAKALGRAENAKPSQQHAAKQSASTPKKQVHARDLSHYLPDPFSVADNHEPALERSQVSRARPSRQQNAVDRPLGPVTLLNTKSSPYADYLIERGYRAYRLLTLNAELMTWFRGDLDGLSLPAIVHLSLSANGTILSRAIERSSGSPKVDNLLMNALTGAVRGTPPPAAALSNGSVQLVLALDTDVLRIGIR